MVRTGEIAGSTTTAQLPNISCKYALIKAQVANAGNVYIGHSNVVTKAVGATNATCGLELDSGQDTGWLNISNLNELYLICDNAGDDVTYMVIS